MLGGVGIGGGGGTGMGGCGRLNLGVSNGKSGSPRITRLRRHTQGSRLSLYADEALTVRGCPRQVTLVKLPTLERASMLHSQEDMVGERRPIHDCHRHHIVSSQMIRDASGEKGRLAVGATFLGFGATYTVRNTTMCLDFLFCPRRWYGPGQFPVNNRHPLDDKDHTRK